MDRKSMGYCRVVLSHAGVETSGNLPDLHIKTPGFRRRDPQLQTWLQGALQYACYRSRGLEIVLEDGWKWEGRTAEAEDELDDARDED